MRSGDAARIQGTVLLSVVVLAEDTVGDVAVIRSLDTQTGLDAPAVSAAKQWLFTPGQKDGVAVARAMTRDDHAKGEFYEAHVAR